MAFFKFRKGGDEQPTPAAQPESVEALRRRAKNRLIGAVILVVAGIVGFPLLVDKEPRPVAQDLPILIPARDQLAPLASPAGPAAQGLNAPAPGTGTTRASGGGAAARAFEDDVPAAAATQGAKPPSASGAGQATSGEAAVRYVVQVGSFGDVARARAARGKLERAGLRHYTQVIETKEGQRIRVRAGPFDSKAEADRAAAKIRQLDMAADVLSL
ncbi:SPOR domain-containing protein [Hylemonella gracilis]|jgi:DedD protein|uniref:SPOR domain-containing protein n=1 Tax=Hylemonella gracilis TaxID=80880 RepID=A0A4P6UPS1_9BURK|nr:SPOR domain-containing protein [Hylemonella gracilis]QBK06145.1 SPOR domain-containing protein [Hylemonella gracilis]